MRHPSGAVYLAIGTDSEDQDIDLVRGLKKARSVNNSRSTEHWTRTINTIGTGLIIADAQKSIEAGKRAVETTTVKEGTQRAAIDSQTTLGLAREETARMHIEAAAPAAAPVVTP